MAKNKKARGNAATKGKARKAKPHVKAKRASRVAKKRARRAAPKSHDERVARAAAESRTGAVAEHIAVPPDTDSGLEPSEEKEILNALNADYDEEGDRDGEDDET